MSKVFELNTVDFLSRVLLTIATNAAMGCAYPSWRDDFARSKVKEVWLDTPSPMYTSFNRRVTVAELKEVPAAQLLALGFCNWDENLVVIPLWVYNYIKDGEELVSIDDTVKIKNKDYIDLDVRFGCIACGFKR